MKKNILFVDDDAGVRNSLKRTLEAQSDIWHLSFASSCDDALELLGAFSFDAIITDVNMPGRDGLELLRLIRENEATHDVPVVILTANTESDLKRRGLDLGATDLLNKPVDREDLVARINNVLRLKEYQDQIKRHNERLEQKVQERTRELELARLDLIWRLGRAGEFRDSETGFHVVRVGYLTRALADRLGLEPAFCENLFHTSPLHDIGKIGIPDRILLKPGKLDADEWEIMKEHTRMGAEILRSDLLSFQGLRGVGKELPVPEDKNPLVEMGANIALRHHERWDGTGYPDGLCGDAIPLEARITTLADVYDALCSKRPYKQALPEDAVLSIMKRGVGTQFDPDVFYAFEQSLERMREIRSDFADEEDSMIHEDSLRDLKVLQTV